MLNVPFCFIDDSLLKSFNVDKSQVTHAQLISPDFLSTKFAAYNSQEVLKLQNFNHLNDYNFVKNDVFSGIDWIYTFVESMYAYDFRVFYFKYYNSFFDDSCDYFYNLFWFFTISSLSFQLFWASLLDYYIFLDTFKLPFLDSWYKSILMSSDSTYIFIYNPELLFLKKQLIADYMPYFSNLFFILNENTLVESFSSPIIMIPQFLFLVYSALIFISFYFNYFLTPTKEEALIDNDYLINSMTVEAEKEITAFDDMILATIVLIYVFGWYFYVHCWALISSLPEIGMLFYVFPALYFVILGMPTAVLYDCGIYFVAYLKGASASSSFTAELVQDYIQVLIFYTRIMVQGVRMIMMLGLFANCHEYVMFFSIPQKAFVASEYFWEEFSSTPLTLSGYSYFFLTVLPGQFLNWIHEVLHTYFVISVQFGAFFAIVFWLILFLYTMFVSEKQEDYFSHLRLKYKN